jgi:uncharacterized protein YjbI with pentapeptide repeats
VRIVGARFLEPVDLRHGRLDHQLWLEHCRFEAGADLAGLRIDGWFSLDGSVLVATAEAHLALGLRGADVAGFVSLSGATFRDVDLTAAKVGGQLSLIRATVDGTLTMNGLTVGQGVLMSEGATFKDVDLTGAEVGQFVLMSEGATFKDVDLTGAKVDGQLDLDGATVDGTLKMGGLTVGQILFMGEGATFKNVDLTGAKVDGQLSLIRATVDGTLTMDSLGVGRDLFMRNATLQGHVGLIFARIGSNLDLSCSEIADLDLSGTRIEGELRLGSAWNPRTRWGESTGIALNLRNAYAGALQDRRDKETAPETGQKQWKDAWPQEPQLDGFTYGRLGGFGGTGVDGKGGDSDVDMQARDVGWYVDWLERDHSYSPQPYQQLAAVFRTAGEPAKADHILYAGRERARDEAWKRGSYVAWLGATMLKWAIGYGLGRRYFRALGWVILFTAYGTAVLHYSGQPLEGLDEGLAAKAVFSLDQLLPIVELESYEGVELEGVARYYFYVQKLIGWALGSFLVAGLAGLTQK